VTNVNPSQAVVTSPVNACVVYGDVTFNALVVDAHHVRMVRFEYKAAGSNDFVPFASMLTSDAPYIWQSNPEGRTYSGTLHTVGVLADGQYLVHAVAIDSAGLVAPVGTPQNISVMLDNAGPAVTLGTVTEPLGDGRWIGGGVNDPNTPIMGLSAAVGRSQAPVQQVAWQVKLLTAHAKPTNIAVDVDGWYSLGTDANTPYAFSYPFNFTNQSIWSSNFGNVGTVEMRALVTDQACSGNRTASSDTATFFIDFSAPRAFFETVSGQAVTSQPVNVTAGVSVPLVAATFDDVPTAPLNVGVDSVEFTVSGPSGT
jgi:hypothetical protein